MITALSRTISDCWFCMLSSLYLTSHFSLPSLLVNVSLLFSRQYHYEKIPLLIDLLEEDKMFFHQAPKYKLSFDELTGSDGIFIG
jgi:hypothetical protein